MPVYATADPVTVAITLQAGDIQLVASDRKDVTVDVGSAADDAARVEFANGTLTVTAPERTRRGPWLLDIVDRLRGGPSHHLTIEVPTGSHLQADLQCGSFRADGELGDCRIRLVTGDVRVDRAASLDVRNGHGDVTVDRVAGDAGIAVSSGEITVRAIGGSATVSDDHSDIDIGDVGGVLRLTGAHGDMTVRRAGGGVEARNAYGSVTVVEAVSGTVDIATTYGDVAVGIAAGTAAWLDVNSAAGSVRNTLAARPSPDGFDRTVEVRVRTGHGDIAVRRA